MIEQLVEPYSTIATIFLKSFRPSIATSLLRLHGAYSPAEGEALRERDMLEEELELMPALVGPNKLFAGKVAMLSEIETTEDQRHQSKRTPRSCRRLI